MSRVRGQKRQLEKARQEKQAEKRERRHARPSATDAVAVEELSPEYPQDEVLAQLADLHRRFGDGAMSLEQFEETRDELVRRLRVD